MGDRLGRPAEVVFGVISAATRRASRCWSSRSPIS